MINAISICVLLGFAVVCDHRSKRIPNQIVYAGTIIGILFGMLNLAGFDQYFQTTFTSSLVGAVTCFAGLMVGWILLGFGGGDVKLATAIGACMGFSIGISSIIYCYLIAGVFSITWLAIRTSLPLLVAEKMMGFVPGTMAKFYAGRPEDMKAKDHAIPMAGFFAAGLAWTFAFGAIV